MQILYEDNRILVCVKPAGVLSTDEPGGMPSLLRDYLKDGAACVRSVHRLDQAVSGVMVYAHSRMAASILGEQVRTRQMQKTYLAVVNGAPPEQSGTLRDLLYRDTASKMTRVVTESGKDVHPAELSYRVLAENESHTLLAIRLHTGRTHQIRVQFASRNCPLVGDKKYGRGENCPIALFSCALSFCHPQTGERVCFFALPPDDAPWTEFSSALLQFSPATL